MLAQSLMKPGRSTSWRANTQEKSSFDFNAQLLFSPRITSLSSHTLVVHSRNTNAYMPEFNTQLYSPRLLLLRLAINK